MSGRGLDRFSRFSFDAFDNRLRGYPSAGLRFDRGVVLRTAGTWNAAPGIRLDAFADTAFARDPGFAVAYAALNALGTVLDKEGLTGSADSYFGLIDHNDLRSEVRASITATPVVAGGAVSVLASESATLLAFDDSLAQTWAGFGAVMVTNVVLSSAQAWIEGGSVGAGAVSVGAENSSTLDATATSKIEAFDKSHPLKQPGAPAAV